MRISKTFHFIIETLIDSEATLTPVTGRKGIKMQSYCSYERMHFFSGTIFCCLLQCTHNNCTHIHPTNTLGEVSNGNSQMIKTVRPRLVPKGFWLLLT